MVNGKQSWAIDSFAQDTEGMKVSRSSQPFDAICIKDFRGKHVHNIASSQDILRRLLPDFTVQFYDAIRKLEHFTFHNSHFTRCDGSAEDVRHGMYVWVGQEIGIGQVVLQ